jgi:hypothetical protein
MDKVVDLKASSGAAGAFGEDIQSFTLYAKCNIPIEFSSDSGAMGTITSSNVGVLALTDSSSTAFLSYTARARFSDK